LHGYYPKTATIQGQQLFKGGIYLKKMGGKLNNISIVVAQSEALSKLNTTLE